MSSRVSGKADRVKVLVITGSMGAGKTTVLGAASDVLSASNVTHAAVDLDTLGIYHLPSPAGRDLALQNLAAIWRNYAAAGIDRLLIAEAMESAADRDRLRSVIPGAEIMVCRLRAELETMQERVRVREPGMFQQRYVERVATLETLLDAAQLEDFSVETDGRHVNEVAREMLERAAWL
jgi:adenylylsulfate kinase